MQELGCNLWVTSPWISLTAIKQKCLLRKCSPPHPVSLNISYPPVFKLHYVDLQSDPTWWFSWKKSWYSPSIRWREQSIQRERRQLLPFSTDHPILYCESCSWYQHYLFLFKQNKNWRWQNKSYKEKLRLNCDTIDSRASFLLSRILYISLLDVPGLAMIVQSPTALQSEYSWRTAFETTCSGCAIKLSCLSAALFYEPHFRPVSSTWKTQHNFS